MKITQSSVVLRAQVQHYRRYMCGFSVLSTFQSVLLTFIICYLLYLDVYDTSVLYTRLYRRLYRLQQHKYKFCFETIYYFFFLSITLREARGIFKRSELQLKSLTQHLTVAWGECPNAFFTTHIPTRTSFEFQREKKSCSNSTYI